MTHFLLIHGSWHGAWCWYKIAPRLQGEGHSVSVVDLPGRGRDRTWRAAIGMGAMLKACAALLPADRKTVIVVHSRYGILASELGERFPERIARVVYLASYMLPAGANALQAFGWDDASGIPQGAEVNRLGLWDFFKPGYYRDVLYHDCSDEDHVLASSLLVPEPSRPALKKLKLTDGRYGSVPRAYIRLSEDRAVSPGLQDRLINEVGADRVETIKAGHSAYFSQPDALARTIVKLSG